MDITAIAFHVFTLAHWVDWLWATHCFLLLFNAFSWLALDTKVHKFPIVMQFQWWLGVSVWTSLPLLSMFSPLPIVWIGYGPPIAFYYFSVLFHGWPWTPKFINFQ